MSNGSDGLYTGHDGLYGGLGVLTWRHVFTLLLHAVPHAVAEVEHEACNTKSPDYSSLPRYASKLEENIR